MILTPTSENVGSGDSNFDYLQNKIKIFLESF